MRFFIILLSILAIPVTVGGGFLKGPELIRVALIKGAESVRVEGAGLLASNENGEQLRESPPFYVARSKEGRLVVNGITVRRVTVTAPLYITLSGRKYRGIVEVTPLDRGLLVVNELPLEEYLVGLINSEISSQWPMEAVKAQAVVARSYAMYQKESRINAIYNLESTVIDQVYDGCGIEDSRAERGVKETAGEVLTYDGKVIQAFYHSNCGGHTEASENVWGIPLAYLRGVDCAYCLKSPSAKWEQTIPLKRIEYALKEYGYQVKNLRDIRAGRKNRSGRVTDVTLYSSVGRLAISAVNLRKAIGYSVIRSTNFEIRVSRDEVLFTGIGYGHGVGLCQWGARQRALDGFDYREILSYYYPGTRLEKYHSD